MSEQLPVIINDIRGQDEFAGISFSLFKRSQVKKSLLETIYKGNLEEANYWTAELVCCGCFLELWEVLLEVLGRYIYTANVKLPVIITKCYLDFKALAMGEYEVNQLKMRNDTRIRRILAEVVTILCLSRKKNKIEYVKIDEVNDFDLVRLSSKMKAPNTEFAKGIIQNEDPSEIFVAVNELSFNLSQPIRNSMLAGYWIEWIMTFEKKCKQRKENCQCKRRDFAPQADNSGKDISFLIWDVFFKESERRNNKALKTIMLNLLELYKIRFTAGVKRRRKHLLYFAIALLCEPLDLSIAPIGDEASIKNVIKNLNLIYGQVKTSEVALKDFVPKTQKEKQKMRSMEKMKILETMGMTYSDV